jgi:23S rRNA (cytosine1962-C5)-methyltransferase
LSGRQSLTPRLVLRPHREARIRGGHPWIYRADVARLDGAWRDDEAVTVAAADGRVLGRGFYNPRPQIVCRLLTRHDEPVDDALLRRRLQAAWAFRGTLGYDGDAGRVVFGEGDRLPGLVVDRYGDVLALQALTRGVAAHAERLAELAAEVTGARAVYRRGEPTAAAIEGFEDRSGWLVGRGEAVVEIREGPCRFHVDLEAGQKTGFYLDQRENRAEIGARAAGRAVLDAFAYTGAFAAWALRLGAASVLALDSSAPACARAAAHLAANAPPGAAARHEVIEANAFDTLRVFERAGRRFDLIVLDPPPFTRRRSAVDAAARGYKEVNLRALRCLRADGLLATFSCSHHVSPALFEEICQAAAEDVGRPVRVAARMSQGRDHPVLLAVPETRYLTGLVLEVLE